MSDPTAKRDPAWLRVLREFGLPVLLTLVLTRFVLRQSDEDRRERRELLARIAVAVEAQTLKLTELALAERAHADAVSATWPRLRLPPSPPARLATSAPALPSEVSP